jgi:hypothetical protein
VSKNSKAGVSKPVAGFRVLAGKVLKAGACACSRCLKSGGSQAGYQQWHTATVSGQVFSRQFTKASLGDAYVAFTNAWHAQFGASLAPNSAVDLENVAALGGQFRELAVAFVLVMGILYQDRAGAWMLAAAPMDD